MMKSIFAIAICLVSVVAFAKPETSSDPELRELIRKDQMERDRVEIGRAREAAHDSPSRIESAYTQFLAEHREILATSAINPKNGIFHAKNGYDCRVTDKLYGVCKQERGQWWYMVNATLVECHNGISAISESYNVNEHSTGHGCSNGREAR